MKKLICIYILFLGIINFNATGQNAEGANPGKSGRNLNIGAGIGYYGYVGHTLPVIMLNYEFDIARNFTLAPFVEFYTYSNNYYWGNKNYPERYYSYRETVVPIGVKGAYYFDELLNAGAKWDFYAAASIGFVFHSITWDNGYYGDRDAARQASSLYLALHVGTRLHLSQKVGLFLDLSTSISTVGISFKL